MIITATTTTNSIQNEKVIYHICLYTRPIKYVCIVRNEISIRLQSRNPKLGKQIALRHNNNKKNNNKNNSNVFI